MLQYRPQTIARKVHKSHQKRDTGEGRSAAITRVVIAVLLDQSTKRNGHQIDPASQQSDHS